ncbi:hypothetical protein BKA80DRAFT_263617 [Phyllosticta citrichinensis]
MVGWWFDVSICLSVCPSAPPVCLRSKDVAKRLVSQHPRTAPRPCPEPRIWTRSLCKRLVGWQASQKGKRRKSMQASAHY